MDVNSSDQNGKPSINNSAEDQKDQKEQRERSELPPVLRPKFSKQRRRRRLKTTSREATISKDDEGIVDKMEEKPWEDEEKPSLDKPSVEKQSVEKDEDGHRGIVPRDTREREPGERETEEPECQDSEIRILTVEPQNSDTDLVKKVTTPVTVTTDDKSDEKRKKATKEGSKRARRKRVIKQKGSGRNSGRKQQLQLSDERRRRRKLNNGSKESLASPRASTYVPLKLDKSAENVARKGRANNKQFDSMRPPSVDKRNPAKKKSFFKNIFDKTKSWMRKSDDVAQPTKEMLFKSYVSPEYDMNNPVDFTPDPSSYLKKILTRKEIERVSKNARCEREDVFINNRPFWIHRTNEDVIPKCKLLSHTGLIAQHSQDAQCFLRGLPERATTYNPKGDSLEKMMAIDKVIGVDPTDPTKEKELKRVTSNTFFSTCHVQAFKHSAEGKRKLEEFEAKWTNNTKDLAPPKVTFPHLHQSTGEKKDSGSGDKSQPPSTMLWVYNRKERPPPPKRIEDPPLSRTFASVAFTTVEPIKKQSKAQMSASITSESQQVKIGSK
ncbi:hypothetical protein GCK72_009241 [Caenorhabditis remanei]|uniref:Uncharacterized protein n=1 Tax=Caenorhabditis remanei TaxID=31234 RepID=A0A6A5GZR4_CAERE|nr:hypothetical protein GCK72_009241 [Caenorhabditis remanei]KAF1760988.1 hypothetical protein GCK72_009241 [Caenorhabditis remanei]